MLHYADSGDISGDASSVVGYLAAAAEETVAVKVFDQHFASPEGVLGAVTRMVDTLLRNELNGVHWQKRNIFSPQYTEVGISPMEIGDALLTKAEAGYHNRPDVFLLACDFARPTVARAYVVGTVAPGRVLRVLDHSSGAWTPAQVLPAGGFQFLLPQAGFFEYEVVEQEHGAIIAREYYKVSLPGNFYLGGL